MTYQQSTFFAHKEIIINSEQERETQFIHPRSFLTLPREISAQTDKQVNQIVDLIIFSTDRQRKRKRYTERKKTLLTWSVKKKHVNTQKGKKKGIDERERERERERADTVKSIHKRRQKGNRQQEQQKRKLRGKQKKQQQKNEF